MICYHFKLDNESEITFLAKTVNSKQSKDRQTNRFLVAAAFQVLINFSCLTVDICSRELPGSGGRWGRYSQYYPVTRGMHHKLSNDYSPLPLSLSFLLFPPIAAARGQKHYQCQEWAICRAFAHVFNSAKLTNPNTEPNCLSDLLFSW